MSEPTAPTPGTPVPADTPMRKRGERSRLLRWAASIAGGLVLLLLLLLAGAAWYTTTADFDRRVGSQVVSVLENATGGKVELGHISFNLWHLAVEADGLVIHGLEGPGEAPYLAADRILLRVRLGNFFSRAVGTGLASHVELSYLRVENPSVHLIVDKNGKTNQPVPPHPTQSNEPVIDTLLDLKAKNVELVHGVALVNDRAIPFNLAAQDLNAQINYLRRTDRYGATIDLRDLHTQIAKQPEAKSSLHVEAEVGRDAAELKKFDFNSGEHSELTADAAIDHFNKPEWRAHVAGSLELTQIAILAGVDGLNAGSVELDVAGHSCSVAPVEAQRKPSFFERELKRKTAQAPLHKTLPPDPACTAGYLLAGGAKLHNAGYKDQYVQLHDINGGAQLHITPTQLLFTALTGYLPGGGSATGELKIDNWLGEVPANTPVSSPTVKGATTTANKTATAITGKPAVAASTPTAPAVGRAHAYLTVTADRIPLATILDITALPQYRNLGFDTSISGPVKAEWGGPATDIADSVLVDAALALAPVGSRRPGANIPVSGKVVGHYDGRTEVVDLTSLTANTPQSSLVAAGVLGVNAGDPLTNLNVDLAVRDLAEYDQLLRTLGVSANGKQGAQALPVALHGTAHFHGTAKGPIARLDIKGHLEATQLDVKLASAPAPARRAASATPNLLAVAGSPATPPPAAAPTEIHIDSLVADAEYTPSGLAVAQSTVVQGSAVLHVEGSFKPRAVTRKRVTTFVWDDGTTIDVKLQLANANVVDVLTIAGQQDSIPLTGTIAVDGHAAGTLKTLSGSGNVKLMNGVAYGEQYESVNVGLVVQGKDIEARNATVRLHGMTITGNGGYDLASQHLHAHVAGNNLQLSKFNAFQNAKVDADGLLNLTADADGTTTQPNLKANVSLANLVYQGKPLGQATIDAHSQGSTVFYTLASTLVGAGVSGSGQTALTGNYQTSAKLNIAGLDIAKPLALFQPGGFQAQSNISGTVTLEGPARTPMAMSGQAVLTPFELTTKTLGKQTLTFQAAEPLSVSLRNGIANLDRFHITGPDTDLRATGTVQVFGGVDKQGKPATTAGKLDLKLDGDLGVALAHTFDPDIISSGKVTVRVAAMGTLADPQLTGKVELQKVNLAFDGIPNGLSDMNGTLIFNQNRLNVQTLVATTGGGKLNLGGYLAYRGGIFADLTAQGDNVRVRLNGLSATANASLRLQGSPQNALLSGTILLTRFGIGADVDFAAFASTGVSAPPDPAAATNKIRMDIHVTSAPQLDFQNSYAKVAGTVDLTVRGTVAEPSVLGRIQITDGSATFAGTKYQLQRGDIYFANPVRIDPTVDLDVTTRVNNYDVTVGLHGTAANLKPTYRSEPPLSETDIFSLLALGRTQEQAQIYQEQQVAAGTDPTTSSLLGGALNATVGSRVSKLFGGGSVKIDPSYVGTLGNSSARITVQQQLSRQLTVTYATNVNTSAQQLIQVQYQLSDNVALVATRDESGVFSIVYKLRRRYR